MTAVQPAEDITDGGERVTHLYPNDCYYAHVSIYRFALQFCQGSAVLDAGSGAGYGAAYLADNGARSVLGVDASAKSVRFSQQHFQRPNLAYRELRLEDLGSLAGMTFDCIFSSNVLEHVEAIAHFFQAVTHLLKPNGVLIVAVPPIINSATQADNLANPYHLNIWSPQQWRHTLSQYFSAVEAYAHRWMRADLLPNFANTPEQTQVDETDFDFPHLQPASVGTAPTITSVFVARGPRPAEAGAPTAIEWIDGSFSLAAEDQAARKARAQAMVQQSAMVQQFLAPLVGDNYRPVAQSNESQMALNELRQRIESLEAAHATLSSEIERKNAHIARLEGLLRQIEQGRIMRWLRRLTH